MLFITIYKTLIVMQAVYYLDNSCI